MNADNSIKRRVKVFSNTHQKMLANESLKELTLEVYIF